jgi:hypothetical protein
MCSYWFYMSLYDYHATEQEFVEHTIPQVRAFLDSRHRASDAKLYTPSHEEHRVVKAAESMGLNVDGYASGCELWSYKKNAAAALYLEALDEHAKRVSDFGGVPDLRKRLNASWWQPHKNKEIDGICKSVDVGLVNYDGDDATNHKGVFQTGQLSWTETAGFVEPLLPPMRHPKFCDPHPDKEIKHANKMSLAYLIHDFPAMCHKLKPW